MKKRILFGAISVIALLIIATSCKTSNEVVSDNLIQKRKYRKGFYVNKKAKVKKDDLVFTGQEDLSADAVFVENNSKYEASFELKNDQTDELIKKEESNKVNSEKESTELASQKKVNNKAAKLDKKIQRYKRNLRSFENGDDPPMKKIEILGLLSFIFAIAGIVSLLLGALLGGVGLAFIILELLAIIFSIISLSRHNSDPNKYKGKVYAKAGLWIPLISLMVAAAVIIIYIFAYAF